MRFFAGAVRISMGLLAIATQASCSAFGGAEGTSAADAAAPEAAAPDGGGAAGPVEIAVGENAPGPIVADANGVYWADKAGAVRRIDKSKPGPVTLALGPTDPVDLRLDLTTLHVYSVAAPLSGTPNLCNALFSLETDGTNAKRIGLAGCTGFYRMTVDATHILLAGSVGSRQIMLIPRQSGTATYTADGTFKLGAIASDGSKLYWSRENGASIATGPKGGDGSGNQLFAPSPSKPVDIAVDADPDGSVFWLTESGEVMAQTKQTPGATPRTLAKDQASPVRLVVDADHVYWTNASNGAVMRVRKDGSGPPEALATGLGTLFGLALADGGVYVTTREGRVLFVSIAR